MTPGELAQETKTYRRRRGVSPETRSFGLLPAFLDRDTGRVFTSRFRNGRPAGIHVIDGLPPDLVLERSETGRAMAIKESVVAGFICCRGQFYTREQASRLLGSHPPG
jgi:hypothetical protein